MSLIAGNAIRLKENREVDPGVKTTRAQTTLTLGVAVVFPWERGKSPESTVRLVICPVPVKH